MIITSIERTQFVLGDFDVPAFTLIAQDAAVAQWLVGAAHGFCVGDLPHVRAVFELIQRDGVDLDGCLALVKAALPAQPPQQPEHMCIHGNVRLAPHIPHHDVCALAANSRQRHQRAVRARLAAAEFLNEYFAGG
jgi:hypothetical protein